MRRNPDDYSCQPSLKGRRKVPIRQSQEGQIIIEYILILVVAVAVAVLITRTLVNRNQENPGIIIETWQKMLEVIGQDK